MADTVPATAHAAAAATPAASTTTAADATLAAGPPPRLSHVPALDGLRGAAFLGVLAYHVAPERLPSAGRVGVDLFFALSGFLITGLLCAEHERTGRVSLRSFLVRRAARLLPALAAFLACYVGLTAVFGRQPWFGGVPGVAGPAPPVTLAAAAHTVAGCTSYLFNLAITYGWSWGIGAPIGHLWSLSVEGQFYLVWGPLLALVLTRRRLALPATAALTAASVAAVALGWHDGAGAGRVYFASWTRVEALLFGSLAALVWQTGHLQRLLRHRRSDPGPDATGPGALRRGEPGTERSGTHTPRPDARCHGGAGWRGGAQRLIRPVSAIVVAAAAIWLVLAVWVQRDLSSTVHATTSIAAIGAAGAIVVVAAALGGGGPVTGLLRAGWLRYVGRRSYALYLWHYPLLAWFRGEGGLGVVVGVVAAFAVAEVSWRVVERPVQELVRRGRQAGSRRHNARGSRRASAKTQRNGGGDQTTAAPFPIPATTSAATASGVVAMGPGGRPAVMRVATQPGRTMVTEAPEPTSASARPWAKPSSPAFEAP